MYAIVPDAPVQLTGAQGEPLRPLRAGSLVALVGAPPPEISAEALRAHDAAVRRISAAVEACLPVRFGAYAADDAALRRELEDREADLSAALDLVRGREQMTLRVTGGASKAPPVEGGPGTRYLEGRRLARTMPELDPLRAALVTVVRAEKLERSDELASVYHLIDRGAAPAYSAIVEKTSLPGLDVRVSGPWPPWSFAPEVAP